MNKLFTLLRFLRLTDDNQSLSLTNLGVYAALVLMFRHPECSPADLATFLGAIASYQVKRYLAPDTAPADATAELKTAIESLQTKVSGLQLSSQFTRK